MSMQAPVLCKLLQWDSEFFGFRIARVCKDTLTPDQVEQVDGWCRDNQVRCLYFLARADDSQTVKAVSQHRFLQVDIRITFECILSQAPPPEQSDNPDDIRIRPVQPDDVPRLQVIARESHTDTRFFADSNFPRQKAEELYSTWITQDALGKAQAVQVAVSPMGQPEGYISWHFDPSRLSGQISLVGVSAESRGKGIGQKLVRAVLGWFRTRGASKITVVTQGKNQTAQRLYQKCGFLSRDLQLWYHKWYPPSE